MRAPHLLTFAMRVSDRCCLCVCQDPRWYPLLSSKYTKHKPELLLSMVLENNSKTSQPSPEKFKAKKVPPRRGQLLLVCLLIWFRGPSSDWSLQVEGRPLIGFITVVYITRHTQACRLSVATRSSTLNDILVKVDIYVQFTHRLVLLTCHE